jgi:hypothetical protein
MQLLPTFTSKGCMQVRFFDLFNFETQTKIVYFAIEYKFYFYTFSRNFFTIKS